MAVHPPNIKTLEQVRPTECLFGTRIGDIVEIDEKQYLQVKCRSCTRVKGEQVYHYVPIQK